jgi:ribosomal-protein-alanine N-acetyltransferase
MTSAIVDAGLPAAPVFARLHGLAFTEAWGTPAFVELLAMPGALGLLATDRGEPVGFLLARRAADEAEILTIGVVPACRRAGIGRALLCAVCTGLGASARRLFLEVAASNLAARRLFEGRGFRQVGFRPAYYSDGSDALVLARNLPD